MLSRGPPRCVPAKLVRLSGLPYTCPRPPASPGFLRPSLRGAAIPAGTMARFPRAPWASPAHPSVLQALPARPPPLPADSTAQGRWSAVATVQWRPQSLGRVVVRLGPHPDLCLGRPSPGLALPRTRFPRLRAAVGSGNEARAVQTSFSRCRGRVLQAACEQRGDEPLQDSSSRHPWLELHGVRRGRGRLSRAERSAPSMRHERSPPRLRLGSRPRPSPREPSTCFLGSRNMKSGSSALEPQAGSLNSPRDPKGHEVQRAKPGLQDVHRLHL